MPVELIEALVSAFEFVSHLCLDVAQLRYANPFRVTQDVRSRGQKLPAHKDQAWDTFLQCTGRPNDEPKVCKCKSILVKILSLILSSHETVVRLAKEFLDQNS